MKNTHPIPKYKPRAVEVRHIHPDQSIEDEAPTIPLNMATPTVTAETVHAIPPVIVLRPSWLDLPAQRLLSRITLIGVCSIPAVIIITAAVHAAWRLS